MLNPLNVLQPDPTPWRRARGPRQWLLLYLGVASGNLLVGILLTVVGFGGTLGQNLVYSQCIGLSICTLMHAVFATTPRGGLLRLGLLLAAGALGGTLGQVLASLLLHHDSHLLSAVFLKSEFIGLFFGAIGAGGFHLRERYWDLEAELKARELQRLEAEKRGVEAQLRMLQAQIEPHFLFNTLANLAGLIESDPKLASRLLEALNHYLRASLRRTRAEGGTLGDELDLLAAYLEVFRIRLGPRLDYRISAAPAERALPFPPMLLQPLVENAIRHGIEPQVAGGRVDITAARAGGELELRVRDTGRGLGDPPGSGFGLDNVRSRLAALFGEAGRLEIAEHPEGGVQASLRLPA
jgi:sensor histidine kinase YesM